MLKAEKNISAEKYLVGTEIERSSKKYLLEMAKQCSKGKALDIGCGTGINADYLGRYGFDITGIDLSETAIIKFREKGYIGIVHDISNGLPFDNNSFELVFASEVIEHMDDIIDFLNEIKRVLKPGGTLLLSTPNSIFWAYRMLTLIGKSPSEYQHPGHLRFFSPKLLKKHFQECQYHKIQMSGRNMYFIIGEKIAKLFMPLLVRLTFLQSEIRFLTKNKFFHISHNSKKVSSFWSDTIFVKAQKK